MTKPERPAFPILRAGRRVRGAAAGALAALTLLVTAAPPALALPAVRPVTTIGRVPTLALDMVDGAALHCPAGVTAWSPLVVPIEMVIPQGTPNGTIDPVEIKNMPDGSALWYRALGSIQSGGTMPLDKEWTQDGRRAMPITQTGLRSGTYLLGALCARPGKDRQTFPLNAHGDLIGEWYVVTFTWVDKQPAQSTFHFERQYAGPGAGSAPTPQPAATAQPLRHSSSGLGWPAWLGIAVFLGLALAIGIRLSRHRREPTRPGTSDLL